MSAPGNLPPSGSRGSQPHTIAHPDHPEWGHDPASPLGFPIVTLTDWHTVLSRPGQLTDEYGDTIPDPLAWLAEATPWKPSIEGRHALEDDIRAGTGWLDTHGFRFYTGEFS